MAQPNARTRLAVAVAIKDAAAAAEKDAKRELARELAPGDRIGARIDGTDVGTISYSKTSAHADVTDMDALVKWCADAYPSEVVVTLDAVDADTILQALAHVSADTTEAGTLAEAVAIRHRRETAFTNLMAQINNTRPAVRASFLDHLCSLVVRHKAPVTEEGELIPGMEYVPGGQAGSISWRRTEEQRVNLAELWRAGRLRDVIAIEGAN